MRPGNFTSIDELKAGVEVSIDYINKTRAKPFKWTYHGKTLAAYMRWNFSYDALVKSEGRLAVDMVLARRVRVPGVRDDRRDR